MTTLQYLRERALLTQNEAARRLGVTQATIMRWEKGISSPSLSMARRIAEVYNATAEELINSTQDNAEPAYDGADISIARILAGLSQQELADMIGCSRQNISQIEKGKHPSGATISAMKKILDLDEVKKLREIRKKRMSRAQDARLEGKKNEAPDGAGN